MILPLGAATGLFLNEDGHGQGGDGLADLSGWQTGCRQVSILGQRGEITTLALGEMPPGWTSTHPTGVGRAALLSPWGTGKN